MNRLVPDTVPFCVNMTKRSARGCWSPRRINKVYIRLVVNPREQVTQFYGVCWAVPTQNNEGLRVLDKGQETLNPSIVFFLDKRMMRLPRIMDGLASLFANHALAHMCCIRSIC